MDRAQRNLVSALAILGVFLLTIVAYVVSSSHDKPIVITDGSIHANAKGLFHVFHKSTSQVEGYYAIANAPGSIHLRGFDPGTDPTDYPGLSEWRVDLVTSSSGNGTGYLCYSSGCRDSSADPADAVHFYVVNDAHLSPSFLHGGLTYTDSSIGCEKLGTDGESVCIHIRGVIVTTGDSQSHAFTCRKNNGNCTVTIGVTAYDPEPKKGHTGDNAGP